MSSKKHKQHDPYSFGQVKLGKPGEPAAEPAADDILFDTSAPPPAADSSWDLPTDGGGGLLSPGGAESGLDFGADILGEVPDDPAPAPTARRPERAVSARPDCGRKPAATAPGAAARLAVPAAPTVPTPAPAGEARGKMLDAPRPQRPFRQPPRLGAFGAALPFLVLAVGIGGAAAVWVTLANPVFAGIGAALGGVGMAFTWIWTRN
ncbi:MAG: hypothetical protein IPK26_29095 [Planctomycetes bacterium]|nr:hypothetical protein [Planctomycetota bacterium]